MAVKKQWFEIVAPKMFDEHVIGETLAAEPKNLVGRTIKVSLSDLGREYSKFYMSMQFQVDRVEGNKAYTKFVGHDCTTERIYRIVQRHMRRVDSIQDCKIKDGVKIRIKTLMILTARTRTSVKSAVRAKLNEAIEKYVSEKTLEELVKDIITDHMQKHIRDECKKIYPVGAVEIRKSEIL